MKSRRAVLQAAVVAIAVLALAGCKTTIRSDLPPDIPNTVERLADAVAADAQRSDTESSSKVREQLSADAGRDATACLDRAPQAVACLYSRAIALGLEARSHPLHASELLTAMLDSLSAAEAADRRYDHGGSARVRALVLVKAPGWPLGPGDPDAGLAAARRAVEIESTYPPNVLALAGALSKTGDAGGARRAYLQARILAEATTASADRDDWLRQIDQGLRQQ